MLKTAKTINFKALGAGKDATDEQLAKINRYALVKLTGEQIYVRQYLVAHNGIDRDTERFSDQLLENFAKTLPGKGLFINGHPSSWGGSGGPGDGKFFDAYTEEMTPEGFKALTGEEIRLPENVTTAKVLWGSAYLLKLDSNADTLAKIDAGICSFVSIGFKAKMNDIADDKGNYIYGEYGPNGEAREGSLVWLGAQPGAAAKQCTNCKEREEQNAQRIEDKKGGNRPMDLKILSEKLGKTLTEDNAINEIVNVVAEKDATIAALTPKAADGEAYRKSLIDNALKCGVLIGEIPSSETEQKAEEDFYKTLPIERLKMQSEKYEKTAREKFPDKFTFTSKDDEDRKKASDDAKALAAKTGGKKDYSSPEHNELFATVGK